MGRGSGAGRRAVRMGASLRWDGPKDSFSPGVEENATE